MSKKYTKTVEINSGNWEIEVDRFEDGDTIIEYYRDDGRPQSCSIVLSQSERRQLRDALADQLPGD